MASLTLTAKLTEVHIITHMARAAFSGKFDLGSRSLVAPRTRQSSMRTGEGKTRHLAMIEGPQVPAIGAVATRTLTTQPALMAVITPMAANTVGRSILVLPGQMTLHTRHGHMQPDERIVGKVVIEAHLLAPALRHMTLSTLCTQLAGMGVLCTMTAHAAGAQFLGADVRGMTGIAIKPVVPRRQGKFAVADMIEICRLPGAAVMTLATALAHATGMGILRPVTTHAGFRHRVLHAAGSMATGTIGTRMCTAQRKTGLPGMIKLRGGPVDRRMALFAIDTARTPMDIIGCMTGRTLHGRAAIAVADVTGDTGNFSVPVGKRKMCPAVIILAAQPGADGMACATVIAQLSLMRFVLAMTGNAFSRCIAVTLACFMAAAAGYAHMCTLQGEVAALMIKLSSNKFDDVGIAPLVLGVTCQALQIGRIGEMPVQSHPALNIAGDILVTIQTQTALTDPIAPVMTIAAFGLQPGMRTAHLAGHQQGFNFSSGC